ncbi:MAG TPA: glycerophosphodiester phosphodiesterase [Rheinheimera sp.]|nr:glycerophosphodiester phosphodiesterase [Rheinheimera sp.]
MQLFAHRGVSTLYPENTLRAFAAALELPNVGIELDVYLHQDQLVVIHDRFVDRTTNGRGALEDFSVSQLAALDAGNGQKIPTLWQVLELCANRCLLNIELKGHDTGPALLRLLARAQHELQLDLRHILVSSFHHPLLRWLGLNQPSLQLGMLIAHYPLELAACAAALGVDSLHCDRSFVDQVLVDDAHQRGLKVHVYTVNYQKDAIELAQMGVDGLFCNHPAQVQQWLTDASLA